MCETTGNMMRDMTCDTRVEQLNMVQKEALNLFTKKNADYGDAFARYGTVGILVRLGDKIHRFLSITSNGVNLVEDEKLRDTLLDLHNYAAMGIMLLDSNASPSPESLPHPTTLVEEQPIESYDITGSNGNVYNIKRFKDNDGKLVWTCSCPSYQYCNDKCKTCKHIKQFL